MKDCFSAPNVKFFIARLSAAKSGEAYTVIGKFTGNKTILANTRMSLLLTVKGQVGTIVEVLDEGIYEVEFADKQGRTITSLSLEAGDLMLLHFERETAV